MKETDKKLKKLFQEKNLENAFSPDEQNWKKMSAVLEKERKGNRRGLLYFSIILLLCGMGTALFFGLRNDVKQSSLAQIAQPPVGTIVSPAKEDLSSTTPVSPGEKSVRNTAPLKTESTKIPAQNTSNGAAPELTKNISATAGTKSGSLTGAEQSVLPEAKVKEEKTSEDKAIRETPAQPEKNIPATQLPQKLQSEEPGKGLFAANERKEDTQSPATVVNNHQGREKATQTVERQVAIETKAITSHTKSIVPAENIYADVLPMKNHKPASSQPELVSLAGPAPVNDSILVRPLPAHRIYLEAGTSYMAGWNGGTEAKGFNPLAGVQYYHDITKRTGLSIGLMYTSVSNLSSTSHTSTATKLKFGEETDVTVISATKMHYLLIPFKLNYALSRNDFIALGYSFSWLLDAESKVEQFQTRKNYASTPVVSRSMGYTKGFSSYDGQLTLCYRRRLYRELYLCGEVFYGLTDIKNNKTYLTGEFERSLGFRLSLGVNLWKK